MRGWGGGDDGGWEGYILCGRELSCNEVGYAGSLRYVGFGKVARIELMMCKYLILLDRQSVWLQTEQAAFNRPTRRDPK